MQRALFLAILSSAGVTAGCPVFTTGEPSAPAGDREAPAAGDVEAAPPSPSPPPAPQPNVPPTPAPEPVGAGQQVGARHILVQWAGAMRAPPFIRRTREEARARATELLLQANRAGAEFDAIARENSDDLGSRERGGDVGVFGRQGDMVEEFARAAFALEVGQVSDIVETPFGYHIIQRYR
jgi:hypothetical protein